MKVNDNQERKSCWLHACLRHSMRLARWTGFFPVQGLNQLTADGTKFDLKCIYGVYNILTLIGQVVLLYFTLHFFLISEASLVSISNILYYAINFTAAISLLRLAKCWPKLMKLAEKTEQSLAILKLDNRTIQKSNILAITVIILTIVTYGLATNFSIKLTIACISRNSSTNIHQEIYASYMKIIMYYIFNFVPYSDVMAAFASICNFQTTVLCSYVDVLTICCSLYITSHFQNLNKIIYSKKNNSMISWGQLREHYSKLALLVKEIDAHLSSFILVSFFSNMYFICVQLFTLMHGTVINFKNCGTEKINNVMATPDYFLSRYTTFSFLMLRFILLSLFTANVHNTAQKPIIPVYSVQPAEYDQEVLRFQLTLRFTTVALSGKLFYVTRNTILQAISTIITYELVLLQFSKTYFEDDSVTNTTSTAAETWA